MSRNKLFRTSRFFYGILSLCLLSVMGTVAGVNITKNKEKLTSPETTVLTTLYDKYTQENVNKVQQGIEKDTTEKTAEKKQGQKSEKNKDNENKDKTEKAAAATEQVVYGLPLGTDILKDYSNGVPVKSKTLNDYRIHTGVDFSGEEGQAVKSVGEGTVKAITRDELYGSVIEIEHTAFTGRYCGFETIEVEEGQKVASGQGIGTLGSIPAESADMFHLHFEALVDGKIVDPLKAIGFDGKGE